MIEGVVEFIIPTYTRKVNLMGTLNSIILQSRGNWLVNVIIDNSEDNYEEVREYFKNEQRIRFTQIDGPHYDWGHTARNYGVSISEAEWVIMSCDDNYYIPFFVERFFENITNKTHFVYCDIVFSQIKYRYMKCEPRLYFIDLGCYMSKTEYAKQLPLDITKPESDGIFVEEYLKKFEGEIIHVEEPLFVHN